MTEEEIRRLPTDGMSAPFLENEYEAEHEVSVCGAKRKSEDSERNRKRLKAANYRETIPCCRCANCIIIREARLGQIVSVGYGCLVYHASVTPFHTCDTARENVRGPMVLVRRLVNAEPRTDFGAIPDSVWDVSGVSKGSEEKIGTEGNSGSKGEARKSTAETKGEEPPKEEKSESVGTSRSEVEGKKPMSKVVPRNLCN